MVIIKITAILIFVFRRGPFHQHGELASLRAATVSRNPDWRIDRFFHLHRIRFGIDRGRRMPPSAARHAVGIIATLLICALLYGSVSLVLTGIAHWTTLDTDSPVANALKALGHESHSRLIVTAGALLGMVSSLLVFQYGQARIWFAMSRDRLLPKPVLARPSAVPDPSHRHLDRRVAGWHSGGHVGYRCVRRISPTSGLCSRSLWFRWE